MPYLFSYMQKYLDFEERSRICVGLLLSTYFGQLQYHKAGTVVLMIVVVVTIMDFASAKIRERMI